MIYRLLFSTLASIGLLQAVHAQTREGTAPVQIRVVLHDPMHPTAELFYVDKEGEVLPVNFRHQALSRAFDVAPINGSLVLYDKAEIDPEDPEANRESIAAIGKIPEGIKKAIVVVASAPEGRKPAYRLLVIEDSEKAFPGGESLVLPLVNRNIVVEAGEHVVPVRPGKLAKVPFVKEKNAFNMAQTNFHYQSDGEWITFAERRLQYLEVMRRIFIIYFKPGATHPTITAIMDNSFQSR